MKLISCHIENFGRLQNFDYVFSDGVNVICRENGWGKSTFAAFLLAMFYGLPAKGKKRQAVSSGNRLSLQNARTMYRPWQGGVFGGQLIFEAGDKTYEMTRVFGGRESEDEFDLRDADTNLPSFDYSKEIGKELFSLDRESFLRTVFTSQQDCLTEPTDDINALILDLAEYAGDMESYEAAQRRLKEAANRLTPGRATGRLSRLEDRIGQLERAAAASRDLEEGIAACGREQKELARREQELEAGRRRLEKEIAAAELKEAEALRAERDGQSLLAKKQIWQRLSGTNERRKKELRKALACFPGRVPTREETDVLLKNCREMERLEERMKLEMLTGEEQERLTLLEERFTDAGDFADALTDTFKADDSAVSDVSEGRSLPGGGIFGAGIALIFIASMMALISLITDSAGGSSSPLTPVIAILLAAAGAGLAVTGALHRNARNAPPAPSPVRSSRREKAASRTGGKSPEGCHLRSPEPYPQGPVDGGGIGKSASEEEEIRAEKIRAYAEYQYLERKEKKLEKTHADWAEARKPILFFLRELGFRPEKDLHAQLTMIRDAADECEDARALLRESEEELHSFEEELGRKGLTAEALQLAGPQVEGGMQEEPRQGGESAASLRRRKEEIQEELLQCRTQAADVRRRMEELAGEREERDAMLEELEELREQQRADLANYRQITAASSLLQRAKESLTARYADPIRTGFCRYWEIITGYSAEGVYLDANSNITVEEGGRQRDAALLSTGWRDLAGICLRTALADAMYPPERGERPPLILDDPFTNLDDRKTEGAMYFLQEAGRHYQILYFTCSTARC